MKWSGWVVGLMVFGLLAMVSLYQAQSGPVIAERAPAPVPALVVIDVHAEVRADGAGQARAVAWSVGGQASADIESEGSAQGQAYANAPGCVGGCAVAAPAALSLSPATPATPGLYAVVVVDLANLRSAPGLTAPLIGVAPRGARFAVQGQDVGVPLGPGQRVQWWEICCPGGQRAWVFADLVVIEDGIAMATPTPTVSILLIPTLAPAVATALPTALPTATPTPDFPFVVELVEQHREANTATIYAFVHEQGNALDGYFLNVTRNGQAVPGELVRSAAVPLGTTASGSPGSVDDRIYNLKMAWETVQVFPGFVPYGAWRVQLIDGAGQPVGPAVLFELMPDVAQLEMYVRYEKRG